MNKQKWAALLGFVVLAQVVGGIGAISTTSKIPTWYAELIKPAFNPPNWVFGPVWTILFLLMGIASFLIWQSDASIHEKRDAFAAYGMQLLLNVLWSVIFFGLQSPGVAFGEIIALWLAIAVTIKEFSKIYRPAAWLMAPYLAWVSFAAFLNFSIWILN